MTSAAKPIEIVSGDGDDKGGEPRSERLPALLSSPAGASRASSSRTAPAPAWRTRSWRRSPTGWPQRGIATLRYQFPYMERGSKRPDPPALAQATVRAAVAEAARRCPGCRSSPAASRSAAA